jgi:hypothetical protein
VADVQIPHFDVPFRYIMGKPVIIEQDSLDDVRNCAYSAARTRLGYREEAPNFGISDPTFEPVPIDTGKLFSQIITSEPRATALLDLEQSLDPFDNLVTDIVQSIEQSGGGVNV